MNGRAKAVEVYPDPLCKANSVGLKQQILADKHDSNEEDTRPEADDRGDGGHLVVPLAGLRRTSTRRGGSAVTHARAAQRQG